MSSKKDSTASNGSATAAAAAKYEARLCHVVKRPDFDGYGFNLHAEKGRPGQYIGKVDDGSPAEAAGLRQGDRIIEVNGTNITTETHKKVVELIKAVPNETKLLVIDPRADAAELKAAIARSKSGGATNGVDVNDNSKQAVAEGGGEQHMMMTNGGTKDSLNENKHDVNNGTNGNNNNNSHEEVNNKKNSSTSSSDKSANKSTMMTNGGGSDAAVKKQPVDQIIEDTKALSVSPASVATAKTMTESNGSTKPAVMNGSSTAANGSASKEGPKLNLNMTAAELRAQLAARKKYDPKNDVCDLRKKYEIIQKM